MSDSEKGQVRDPVVGVTPAPGQTMPATERGSLSFNWTVTYLLLVAISGGLLWVGYRFGENTLWGHLLSELGVAGLVAFVLAFTIERLSGEEFKRRAERERIALQEEFRKLERLSADEFKQRAESERIALQEEFRKLAEAERNAIKRDVFHQTYGNTLPKEIRDELDHQVLQSDFIRSGLYLRFELTIEKDPKTSDEYVKSKCRTISHIENICGHPRNFPIEHSIDQSPSDGLKDEVKYLEFTVSGSETEFSLKDSDLKTMTQVGETQISLDLSKDPNKHQVVVLPDQPTKLTIQYQGIRTMKGGGIYFSFTSHTCYLEVTVNVMNRDLEVFAESYSPHRLKQTDRHDPGNGYYDWMLKKPLLCYQAIRVTWKRRPAILSQQPTQTL